MVFCVSFKLAKAIPLIAMSISELWMQLFDYIVRKKRLTDQEAQQFFLGILEGLNYLHELGVVVRTFI